jgi:hypothetical protein
VRLSLLDLKQARRNLRNRNRLEKAFLEQVEFNVSVPASTYTKYYLDLKTLAQDIAPSLSMSSYALANANAVEVQECCRVTRPLVHLLGCNSAGC